MAQYVNLMPTNDEYGRVPERQLGILYIWDAISVVQNREMRRDCVPRAIKRSGLRLTDMHALLCLSAKVNKVSLHHMTRVTQ